MGGKIIQVRKTYRSINHKQKPGIVNKISLAVRSHFWRWVRFTLLGTAMTGVSFGVLYLQVHSGIKPTYAYLVENVFMLQLGFAANRYLTFGDRNTPFLESLVKWNAFKSVTFGLSQILYFVLIHVAREQYMLASITVAASFGIFNYALSNKWAFAKNSRS